MPDPRPRGCLIAVDGADSGDVATAAATLHQRLTGAGLPVMMSRWDASGLFADVAAAPAEHRDVSPRTVTLLYGADLAFRLRWQIEPALAKGHVVIAAPFVATATAFGLATGLSASWLRTLLRFMPAPDHTVVLHDRRGKRVWKRRPDRGFCDCATAFLEATPEEFRRRRTRRRMNDALSSVAEPHGGLRKQRDVVRLADEIAASLSHRAGARPSNQRAR